MAGTFISNESFTANYNEIDEAILKKASNYAKFKDVLEEKQQGNLYRVKISCFVYPSGLKKDLEYVVAPSLSPVLIVISETNNGEKVVPPYSETEIIKKFSESGFKVIGQDKITNDIRDAVAAGTQEIIMNRVTELGAKAVISGDAYSEGKKVEDLQSGTITFKTFAQVEARAIDVKTGEIFDAEIQNAENVYSVLPNWAEAEQTTIEGAADLVTELLLVNGKSSFRGGPGYSISMQISGDSKFNKYKEFKFGLGRLYGFLGMDEQEFDADTGKATIFYHAGDVSPQDIVTKINGRKTESGYSISAQLNTIIIKSQQIYKIAVQLN